MITITPTKHYELIKKIVTTPILWEVENGQDTTLTSKTYRVDKTQDWLLIRKEDQVIGLFSVRGFTKIVAEVHSYILPHYWGTPVSKEAVHAGFKYLHDNNLYLKVFTMVPEVCTHVIKHCQDIGWAECGSIKAGVIYNGRLQTLILFDKDLEEV